MLVNKNHQKIKLSREIQLIEYFIINCYQCLKAESIIISKIKLIKSLSRLNMDPVELEYIGEKEEIGVIPNFNFDPIHLISGTIGKSLINSIELNH